MNTTMNTPYPQHHSIKTGHLDRCQVCNSTKTHLILDLGHQPPCDSLLTIKTLNTPEKTYPLRMMWCEICTLVQIDYCVDGAEVYHQEYPYRTGISKPLVTYQKDIAKSLIKKYSLKKNDLVIDIGSNDGTLLSGFKIKGIKTLGIEPTNMAQYANRHGIKTIQKFFEIKTAKQILKEYGKAKLITTTNVFAHMQTLGEVIMGVYNLLEDDGVFISETHYLMDVIKDVQFDTIYHEHLRTYSLKSLIILFNQYDFTITDVERGSRYGGNIRIHVMKGKNRPVSKNVSDLLKLEKDAGLDSIETYRQFAIQVKKARLEFMDFIIKAKKKGKTVVGKSCPGRASTLLNYYGVDKELMPYLAELHNSLKLGMYLPGKHIPIVKEKILFKDQPDFLVILSRHYQEVITTRLKKAGLKSDFVIPLPNFRIIKNSSIK